MGKHKYFHKGKTLIQWCEELGIPTSSVHQHIRRHGVSLGDALEWYKQKKPRVRSPNVDLEPFKGFAEECIRVLQNQPSYRDTRGWTGLKEPAIRSLLKGRL